MATNKHSLETATINNEMVKFSNYTKRFTHKEVIGPLNFAIQKNKITIIIGRSGAGKSVLLNSIMGTYAHYKGVIEIAAHRRRSINGHKVNDQIGFYTQMDFINYDIKLLTYLQQIAKIMGLSNKFADSQIEKLLTLFQLKEHADKKVKDFSWGMKNRLNMILCLLKDPELIILDEPGANLDSLWRKKIKSILLDYKNHNKTVVLVVHNIDEVFDISDDLIVIDQGQIMYQSEIKTMKLYFKSKLFFKSDIANHKNYAQFKQHLQQIGFVIFDEDLVNKSLEIGVLREKRDNVNFLVALIVKYNLFLEEIINLPMNYESIYNSLVVSDQIKELEFYFKKIDHWSKTKLKFILLKETMYANTKKLFTKKPETKTACENYLQSIQQLKNDVFKRNANAELTDMLLNNLYAYFSNNFTLQPSEQTALKALIEQFLQEPFLTAYEQSVLKLGIEVHLRKVQDKKHIDWFNHLVLHKSKKRSVNKVNVEVIRTNTIIMEHVNQLFW